MFIFESPTREEIKKRRGGGSVRGGEEQDGEMSRLSACEPVFRASGDWSSQLRMAPVLSHPIVPRAPIPAAAIRLALARVDDIYLHSRAARVCPAWGEHVKELRHMRTVPVGLFSLCMQLDVACRIQQDREVSPVQLVQHSQQQQRAITENLHTMAKLLTKGAEPAGLLDGLHKCFPSAAQQLSWSPRSSAGRISARDYLAGMAAANQARTIADQICQDVKAGNHKYLAHQVAVMYQSLGQVGPAGAPSRKAIQAEFGAIKAMVEGGTRHLSDGMVKLLVQICGSVMADLLPTRVPAAAELGQLIRDTIKCPR
eukprot:TRINITY_DN39977_c0_g1_i1.p1 TRINITY_DN39977_c0_g1~~TRINITY_DN39977_c0_g1_i1.p1  ORF type:complete len:313 (-),score=60.54 TRINITY_DN39977_c0_g1_i1:129-1067(-)